VCNLERIYRIGVRFKENSRIKNMLRYLLLIVFSCSLGCSQARGNTPLFKNTQTARDTLNQQLIGPSIFQYTVQPPTIFDNLYKEKEEKNIELVSLTGHSQENKRKQEKGFTYLDEGIKRNPDRLDMRFGKIFMLGQLGFYDRFTEEIVKTLEYSKKIDNRWIWSDGKLLENPAKSLLDAIREYQVQLYETSNDDYLYYIEDISKAVLKLFPGNIESMMRLSIVYIMQNRLDEALATLKDAEKITPHNCAVLSNIAYVYKLKGTSGQAVKYYQLVKKYGTTREREQAQEAIDELKRKI